MACSRRPSLAPVSATTSQKNVGSQDREPWGRVCVSEHQVKHLNHEGAALGCCVHAELLQDWLEVLKPILQVLPALATVLIKLAGKLGADQTHPTVQDMHRHFLPCVHSFNQILQDFSLLKA